MQALTKLLQANADPSDTLYGALSDEAAAELTRELLDWQNIQVAIEQMYGTYQRRHPETEAIAPLNRPVKHDALNCRLSREARAKYIATAREIAQRDWLKKGTLEIDDRPNVSVTSEAAGAYVAAWVWVGDDEL